MAERKEDVAEAEAEQDRVKTARLETRRAKQAEIAKHEKERTEKAEKWKTDRIEAMKERQVKFAVMESGHEDKIESKMARRQVSFSIILLKRTTLTNAKLVHTCCSEQT